MTNDWKYVPWDTSTSATSASFHLQGRRSTSSPPGELGQLYLGSRGWWMDGEYLFFVSISRSEKSWIYPDTVILEKQTFLWNKPTRLGWHSFVQSGAVKHRHLRDFLLQLGVGLLHLATATAGLDMELLKDAPKNWAKAGNKRSFTREYSRTTVAKCSNIKFLCLECFKYRQLGDSKNHPTKKKNIAAPQGQLPSHKNTGLDYPWFQLWEFSLGLKEGTLPHFAQFFDLVIPTKLPDSGGKIPEFGEFFEVFTKCDPCDQLMAGRQGKM